jgi:predicted nucleic acid-binding protein
MTIDSNIVIAFLGGEDRVVAILSTWKEEGIPLFLPTIVESEVLSFAGWTDEEQRATERFLEDTFASVPFDRSIARMAAAVRRGGKIKFPDAAIAATALFTHTPLVTRNQQDFKHVPNLRLIVP